MLTLLTMRCISLQFAFFIDRRTFANVGKRFPFLQVFKNLKSNKIFSYFDLRSSNDLTAVKMSFPCFLFICLKI